jgi:hypothetical protein
VLSGAAWLRRLHQQWCRRRCALSRHLQAGDHFRVTIGGIGGCSVRFN